MGSLVRVFAVCFVAALAAGCSGSGGGPAVPEQQRSTDASQKSTGFKYSVHPIVHRLADFFIHNCPGGNVCGLTPTTLRTSYNFSYVQGTSDGTGQTIVIVDAFGSPNILQDLQFFANANNLQAPVANADLSCTGDTWTFCVVYPGGKPSVNTNNATQLGWAEETSLDVEWAHASAPGARIALVVANNDQGQTLQSTIQYATTQFAPSIVSLSFGAQEASINGGANNTQLHDSEAIYTQAVQANDTVIASAGDLGSSGGFSAPNPQYPASDPHVLSVGGTNLTIFNNGRYRSESAWNDGIGCTQPCGATGGAASTIFPGRNVADVAYDAADQAVAIYMSFVPGVAPGWFAVGGTSIGPPAWAGIVAIANQERSKLSPAKGPLAFLNADLATVFTQQSTKTPPFHDVTNGDNIFYSGINCCAAGPGYDNPTGYGTPDVNNLINDLVNLIQ